MKHRYTLLTGFALFITASSFAQTVEQKIEAQAKDPKRMENAAKADVYSSRNKSIIADTTATYATTSKQVKSKSAAAKTKKKNCKKKS